MSVRLQRLSGLTNASGTPALRLDLAGLTPDALVGLSAAAIERLMLPLGNTRVPLGECFSVQRVADDQHHLVLVGDLSRCDQVGAGLAAGRLTVDGPVGHQAGIGMAGGELAVAGDAGLLTACEMVGGLLSVAGNVGDWAASARPGSLDGMRGGTLRVMGNAGARLADRMRRGTVLVWGDAGDFAASRLVAGTLAVGGRLGTHPAYGMRRGTLVLAGAEPPEPPPGFVPAQDTVPVFWQLLARDLAPHGGPFAELPRRQPLRHRGDLAVDGRGEWLSLR